MFSCDRPCRQHSLVLILLFSLLAPILVFAQEHKLISCLPIANRTQPEGCWILADKPVGTLSGPVYWTLDTYPTRESAEHANTGNGAILQTLEKTWLFTVGQKPAPPSAGTRIAQIGPLPIKPDESYSAQFMEGILQPGSVSRTHVHSGPEAFYTEAGESCLETPDGKQIGSKGRDIIVPEGTPMELVATGKETRRGIILVLHATNRPATTMVMDWKSKNLCLGSH